MVCNSYTLYIFVINCNAKYDLIGFNLADGLLYLTLLISVGTFYWKVNIWLNNIITLVVETDFQ